VSQNQRTCDGERKDQVLKEAVPYLEEVGGRGGVAGVSGGRAQVGGCKMGEQGIFLLKKIIEPNRRRFSK